jgi:hypothetical protein
VHILWKTCVRKKICAGDPAGFGPERDVNGGFVVHFACLPEIRA